MKPSFISLFLLAVAAGCSPVAYDVAVDVRKPAVAELKLNGVPPSVVSLIDRDDSDTLYFDKMARGVAESIEKNLMLRAGDVPVVSVYEGSVNLRDSAALASLLRSSGSDRILVLHSAEAGDYILKSSDSRIDYEGYLVYPTYVYLPYRFEISVYSQERLSRGKRAPEMKLPISDTVRYTYLSRHPEKDSKITAETDAKLPDAFLEIGQEIGCLFFPSWETQYRTVASFDELKEWDKAYRLARDFKWGEALNIWMELAQSSKTRRAGLAAYNAAVACELLQEYELGLEWLNLAEDKYDFICIARERKYINEAIKRQSEK